ncbi:hypothetical protein, partial [Bradyrhizobium liaoningense]|uniref:hypothetical protein n=1 Tax=Bradyrhizobium liaoningense TaxID=43992 RepID=UPI001BAACF95
AGCSRSSEFSAHDRAKSMLTIREIRIWALMGHESVLRLYENMDSGGCGSGRHRPLTSPRDTASNAPIHTDRSRSEPIGSIEAAS